MQAPSGGGSKTPLIILAVVGIAAVAAGAFFLLSSGDDSSGPEGAVRSLVSASNNQDCDRAQELVTENLRGEICSNVDDGTSTIDSIETVDETDSTATVTATITTEYPDEEEPYTGDTTFQLVNEDGSWLVSGFGAGSTPSDPGTTDPGGEPGTDLPPDATLPPDITLPDPGDSPIGSDTTAPSTGGGSSSLGSPTSPPSYSPSDGIDSLEVDACYGGDMAACDDLWWDTPSGSEIENWSGTCGGRTSEYQSADCESRFGAFA